MKKTTPFRAPDGTQWSATVSMASNSGAMVTFQQPGDSARFNRYAWMNVTSREAHDPREHLDLKTLTASLTERELARLFRRSVPVSTDRPSYIVS